MDVKNYEIWFITGAQLLYGGETVRQVEDHSRRMADGFNRAGRIPYQVVYKGTVNSTDEIVARFEEANASEKCAGVVLWMHTFSPAKMWIRGLQLLRKPILHLHTQFQPEIPWSEIDMDFMNLNQSAHGDREFGYIMTRMKKPRKVVVGHWEDADVQERIGVWSRVCAARADSQGMRLIRFGDNMNAVAVTDGDRIEAETKFGYRVDYCPVGELAAAVEKVTKGDLDDLMSEYEKNYDFAENCDKGSANFGQIREAARLEIGLRSVLTDWKATAFTTNFDALHGLNQLPGLAAQRLMNDGYGFGAEGDWKTAAMVRTMKVAAAGLPGGTSFLEDYVYHFRGKGAILQAHMLEVCPSIAANRPRLEVWPLGIGGKADPARLVFTAHEGAGVAATIVDLGDRFRMIVTEVDVRSPEAPLPKLPVARAFWTPRPDLKTAAAAWILAGGTHHTAFSFDLTREHLEDFAEMAQIEFLVIGAETTIPDFKRDLKIGEAFYR